MRWFCKKKSNTAKTVPVMDVITPAFRHSLGFFYFGLDKRENKMYSFLVKPPPVEKAHLKQEDLNQVVFTSGENFLTGGLDCISPIDSIKKMKSGGIVVCWFNGRISIYEPLEKGEVLVSNLKNREVLTRYDRGRDIFPLTGHAEFDLLECLFKV